VSPYKTSIRHFARTRGYSTKSNQIKHTTLPRVRGHCDKREAIWRVNCYGLGKLGDVSAELVCSARVITAGTRVHVQKVLRPKRRFSSRKWKSWVAK